MQEEETRQEQPTNVLGRYMLRQRIGRGGMGDVWLANDPRLQRQVAIKTLPLRSQQDDEFAQRFEREARVVAALNHPHILPIHDYGRQALAEGQVITYIVMPYIAGGTLADRLEILADQRQVLPLQEALSYLTQAAEAIDYAHQQGVLHRDIKPSNMLLRESNWLLLADFGIARILSDQEQAITRTGPGFGTPEYMAPEQAQGKAEAASDNYSLAVIAYLLLSGRLPFTGDSGYGIMVQHMIRQPPAPHEMNATIPLALETVLLQGLAKEPAQRPASARGFVEGLRRALQSSAYQPTLVNLNPHGANITDIPYKTLPDHHDTTIVPTRPIAEQTPGKTGVTRRQVLIGGGALVLIGGAAGAWALTSRGSSTQGGGPKALTATIPVDPNAPQALLGHNKAISSLAWSPQSDQLLSSGKDGQVMRWDAQIGPNQQPAYKSNLDNSLSMPLAWSPDGTMVAIGNAGVISQSNNPFSGNDSIKLYVYKSDLSSFAPGYTNKVSYAQINAFDALCWSPGRYLFTSANINPLSNNPEVRVDLWDSAQPGKRYTLPIPKLKYSITHMLPSPDGSLLALGASDTILIGEAALQSKQATWKARAEQKTTLLDDISWSPDGRFLAILDNDQDLTIWDWQHGQATYTLTLQGVSNVLKTLAWSPTGTKPLLAIRAEGGTVYLFQPAGRTEAIEPVRTLQGFESASGTEDYPLAWSKDGKWLATGYNDQYDHILLWKI